MSALGRLVPALAVAAGLALGVAGVVLGGADDSPGLQLIGVLVVTGTVVAAVRRTRRRP